MSKKCHLFIVCKLNHWLNLIILVRLADHLTRVHELSGIERKHWLQFAKLQNSNVCSSCLRERGCSEKAMKHDCCALLVNELFYC